MTSSVLVRAMTPEDIGAGLHLCRLSQWNQVEDDWRCFLDSPHGGGRLAEKNGKVVGTVTYLRYAPSFSWLSMMLVDPQERRTGIGSQLMEAALEAVRDESCVRLDATPLGQPLYRRYGFIPEYELARASTVAGRCLPFGPCVRPMGPGDLAEVLAWDREIFGADRSALLASFYRRAPEFAEIARDGARLTGYCFGRPGYLYWQLGPIVAACAEVARELAAGCLSRQTGERVAIVVPRRNAAWIAWLESIGFAVERPFVRMYRGENAGLPERQFAIAGPEFG